MIVYFVDTSALAKRYIPEVGSPWTAAQLTPARGNIIIISKLALVEMHSLLARRRSDGSITSDKVVELHTELLRHWQQEYLLVLVDDDVLNQAQILADKHTIRTLDAIQLACALSARKALQVPMTFLGADPKLLVAASIEGFAIDNPLNHP